MHNLFDVLPDSFFNLLTGRNKQLYAEAILLLFEHAQTERFGVRYDIMRDLFQELIESHKELGMTFFISEDEGDNDGGFKSLDESVNHEDSLDREVQDMSSLERADLDVRENRTNRQHDQLTLEEVSRAQASTLLRRLQQLGWIQIEVRDHFEQFIVLPHYANRVLSLFVELCQARTVEYQRFAFVTYQLLTSEEARQRPSFAIREAYGHTLQFQQELITLYQNMKHHMEQIVQKTSIEEVLDHHFDVYKSQIVDKSYHRLKTSDHVSRYRVRILESVQNWLLDKDLMQETTNDGLASDFYDNVEEAEEDIRALLFEIEKIYTELDDMFYQIDKRHNQYLRSSYDRAKYLSQQNEGLDQRIARILTNMHDHYEQLGAKQLPWNSWFRLQEIEHVNEHALLPPRKKRAKHTPQVHEVVPISEDIKRQVHQENKQRMLRAVSRKKIERFVNKKLQGRSQMELRDMAPESVDELVYLGYVYLYGQDGGSSFTLERQGERHILQIGTFRFNNHVIKKKGG